MIYFGGTVDDVVIYTFEYIHCNDTAKALQCLCKGYAEVLQLAKTLLHSIIK